MASIAPPQGSNQQAARKPWLSKQMRADLRGYLFVSPWLASLLIFTAYPMLASFYFSFTKYTVLNPPRWIGLDNFVNMFTRDPLYWLSVGNTFYYTLFAVPLGLVVSLGLAILLNQKAHGIGIYRTIYYLPSLMPVVAGTLLWLVLLDPRLGMVNQALDAIGLPKVGWLKSAQWSKPGLILMSLWSGSGTAMLIFLAGLKDVPKTLLEAALIDGATNWQRFRYVTIPLLTPTIFFNLVIGIITSFQIFGPVFVASSVTTSGGSSGNTVGPLNSLLVYMVLLYRNAFKFFDMGYASAMALVLFVVLVALTLLLVRSSNVWVHYEGGQRN